MVMTASISHDSLRLRNRLTAWLVFVLLAVGTLLAALPPRACAESKTSATDPFETAAGPATPTEAVIGQLALYDPFESASPIDTAAYLPESPAIATQQELVFLEPPSNDANAANEPSGAPEAKDAKKQASTDPCAGAPEKPMYELGINIILPSGLLPKDHAALCWAQRNAMGGPFPAQRCWGSLPYLWDAPCLCYRPLYFEEINLERHGYGCCACIQPAVSAAHFFGTIPCLPYCMAEHCPCECEYTLGHYRPGSCPPWQHHWPSCQPIAAAAEAGVVTGLIFAIP
jgi:hypothetical protein